MNSDNNSRNQEPQQQQQHGLIQLMNLIQQTGSLINTRYKFELLVKCYFDLYKNGCINNTCDNTRLPCANSNNNSSGNTMMTDDVVDDTQVAKLMIQRASQSLTDNQYYFCSGSVPCLTIPDYFTSSSSSSAVSFVEGKQQQQQQQMKHYMTIHYSSFITLYDMAKEKNDYQLLNTVLRLIFSSVESLSHSFYTKQDMMTQYNNNQNNNQNRDLLDEMSIDFDRVEEFYRLINNIPATATPTTSSSNKSIMEMLIDSMTLLFTSNKQQPQQQNNKQKQQVLLRHLIIVLQCPQLMDPSHHSLLTHIMTWILSLDAHDQHRLIHKYFSSVPKSIFSRFVSLFQQYMTVKLYVNGYIDENIAYATRVIGMLNDANEYKCYHRDRVHYDEFYNDAVNNVVDLREDYKRWIRSLQQVQDMYNHHNHTSSSSTSSGGNNRSHNNSSSSSSNNSTTGAFDKNSFENFSFCHYPFILDPQSKSQILQLDIEDQQQRELRNELLTSIFTLTKPNYYLELRINRDRLLQSALNEINSKPNDLKKLLKVHFVGEEGVDAGGVQKEFFQLVVRDIFDVQYGMFEHDEKMGTFWFNSNSYENENNFRLIGTILGLAIYNGVILNVHFPLVVYKKLLGMKPTFEDLKDMDPELGHGLQELLNFEGNVEDVFCRTFQVETEAFGQIVKHDLKPNGAEIPLTNENRQEYVDLYVDWKLNRSIKDQFSAFYQGFSMVVNNQNILHLFRPEELELMVCGSLSLDFDALERVTKYTGGFSKDDPLIKEFWNIVKGLSEENKKKFLSFCTGSDRVPIKGLGSMPFAIVKNGDDSDRLPTAHTCFNYLLLPRYNSGAKLKERLLTAIQNFHGFGLQ